MDRYDTKSNNTCDNCGGPDMEYNREGEYCLYDDVAPIIAERDEWKARAEQSEAERDRLRNLLSELRIALDASGGLYWPERIDSALAKE